jgi:hypothetical protein
MLPGDALFPIMPEAGDSGHRGNAAVDVAVTTTTVGLDWTAESGESLRDAGADWSDRTGWWMIQVDSFVRTRFFPEERRLFGKFDAITRARRFASTDSAIDGRFVVVARIFADAVRAFVAPPDRRAGRRISPGC